MVILILSLLLLLAAVGAGALSNTVLDGVQLLQDGDANDFCPWAITNTYFYNAFIEIEGYDSISLSCTDAERRQIGEFLDEHFDLYPSNSGGGQAAEKLQTESIICADYSADNTTGRKLVRFDNGRRAQMYRGTYAGTGQCRSCSGGGDDNDGRKLHSSFGSLKAELEPTLSDALTTGLISEFVLQEGRQVSCLYAQDHLEVAVTLEEASAVEIANPCDTDPKFCCVPKGNVGYDCLADKNDRANAGQWWCQQEEWRCTDICNGFWADQENPPTCLSLWQECETGDDCCGDRNSCQGHAHNKQCSPVA